MEIKRTFDNMPRLVFWRIDDAMVFLIPFSLGILFGNLVLMLCAFAAYLVYKKLRRKQGSLNLKALIYWTFGHGFSKIPSHVRRIRR